MLHYQGKGQDSRDNLYHNPDHHSYKSEDCFGDHKLSLLWTQDKDIGNRRGHSHILGRNSSGRNNHLGYCMTTYILKKWKSMKSRSKFRKVINNWRKITLFVHKITWTWYLKWCAFCEKIASKMLFFSKKWFWKCDFCKKKNVKCDICEKLAAKVWYFS